MSEIDLILKNIWRSIIFILIVLIAMNVLNMLLNNQVAEINARLTQQEQYMHQVQADVDNLYRVVE